MARWLRERNRAETQYGNKKSVYQFFRPFIIHSPRAATKFQKETSVTAPCATASLPHLCVGNLARDRGAILTWMRILLIGCCALCILPAQTDDEAVYDLTPDITPPRIVKQVNPRYPTNRGVRAVGSVIIGLVVSSKGLPKDPYVLKGIDKDLDQSAVDAVKEWRFAPAQKNAKPVAVRISLQIEFHEM